MIVADDQSAVREGLVLLLGTLPGIVVAGEAADGNAAVDLVAAVQPQVVLMDLNMPGCDGVERHPPHPRRAPGHQGRRAHHVRRRRLDHRGAAGRRAGLPDQGRDQGRDRAGRAGRRGRPGGARPRRPAAAAPAAARAAGARPPAAGPGRRRTGGRRSHPARGRGAAAHRGRRSPTGRSPGRCLSARRRSRPTSTGSSPRPARGTGPRPSGTPTPTATPSPPHPPEPAPSSARCPLLSPAPPEPGALISRGGPGPGQPRRRPGWPGRRRPASRPR